MSPKRTTTVGLIFGAALLTGCVSGRMDPQQAAEYAFAPSPIQRQYAASQVTFEDEPIKEKDQKGLAPVSVTESAVKLFSLGPGADPQEAQAVFREGEALFAQAAKEQPPENARTYLAAQSKYAEAAKLAPKGAVNEDAMFKMAECYFFADQYAAANLAYEKLLKDYTRSRYLDIAESRRFKIAQYWLNLSERKKTLLVNVWDKQRPMRDTRGHAMRVLDRIRMDDPTGNLADDATMAAGVAAFEQGDFLKADEFFTDLREHFPNSDHQFQAHFLGVQAKLQNYQGAAYSGDALETAADLIQRAQKQFPQESQQHADKLREMLAEVRFRMAKRELVDAQFYDKRREFGAAREHYAAIVEKFPDTSIGKYAEQRLGEIEGEPPAPPQRLGWLINAFPDSERNPLMVNSQFSTQR